MGPCSHWDEDIQFSVQDWKDEVRADETRLGYWDWVNIKRTLYEGVSQDA